MSIFDEYSGLRTQAGGEEPRLIRPSLDDLKHENFEKFILDHEREGYDQGFLWIEPPPEFWQNVRISDAFLNRKVRPSCQTVRKCTKRIQLEDKKCCVIPFYKQTRLPATNVSLAEFKKQSLERLAAKGSERSSAKFWEGIQKSTAVYGDEVEGSRCALDSIYWSLPKLDTLLHRVCSYIGLVIFGVTTPYLYYGDWMTKFCWHVEDLELFSLNFHHEGADKTWYIVPPIYRRDFEAFVKRLTPLDFNVKRKGCENYIHHKNFILNPKELQKVKIPYTEVAQKEGQIMVTFPGAYHSGFNHGFNCAEAVNFAMPSWVPFGAKAKVCGHSKEAVKFTKAMKQVTRIMESEFYAKNLQKALVINSEPNPLTADQLLVQLAEVDPQILSVVIRKLLPKKFIAVTPEYASTVTLDESEDGGFHSDAETTESSPCSSHYEGDDEGASLPKIKKLVRHSPHTPYRRTDFHPPEMPNMLINWGTSESGASERSIVDDPYEFVVPIGETKTHGVIHFRKVKAGWQCRQCGVVSKFKRNCVRHIQIKHTKEKTAKKTVKCPMCSRTFYHGGNLKRHLCNCHYIIPFAIS